MQAIARPLSNLSEWTTALREIEIPVLEETATAIELLRTREDDVHANLLGERIAGDPLMTLKLLVYASTHRPRRLVTETETVISTLVMMGIGPFFRAFESLETVEQRLKASPQALDGLCGLLGRSNRAARFALAFAVHRGDHDAAVIHLAATLHDFAEMLLWCHAPDLALQLQRSLRADRSLRSARAQRDLLSIELAELEQALMTAWSLPHLLVRMTDDRRAIDPQVQTVKLAVQLARHTADGWDNPAVPNDVAEIAALLNLAPGPTVALLRDIDGS